MIFEEMRRNRLNTRHKRTVQRDMVRAIYIRLVKRINKNDDDDDDELVMFLSCNT